MKQKQQEKNSRSWDPQETAEMTHFLKELLRVAGKLNFRNQCETENAARLKAWEDFKNGKTDL